MTSQPTLLAPTERRDRPAPTLAPAPTSSGFARIIAVLAFTGVIAAGMQTLIVPLIGQLPAILGASPDDAVWAITATLLASAVSIPIVGRLGDMLGKRRMLMLSLIPLILGSVLCAMAGSLLPMVAGRALQGLGMGVIPLGISLLRELLPTDRVGPAVATMSASMGIGGAIALPFAAAIAEYASWRGMFWAFAGFAALALAAVAWLVPKGAPGKKGESFDFLGAILLAGSLVSLLLAVSKGAAWGWSSGGVLGLLGAAAVLLVVWVRQELRTQHPLVNVRSLATRPVALTNLASFLIGFAMYAQSLVIPQLMQLPEQTGYGLGQSMLQMALWLIPGGITMMIASALGSRLTSRRGPKTTLVSGAAVVALGYGVSLLLLGTVWGLMIAAIIISAGVGLAYGAIPMLVMGSVPPSETAAANGFNTLVRSVGTSGASALIGVILAALSTDVAGHMVPALSGFQLTLVIGGGAALLAAVVALCIPRAGRRAASIAP